MEEYQKNGGATAPIGTLLDGIFADAKNLLVHELKLSKLEFRLEVQKLQTAAVVLGIGAVLLVIGASLLALMVAQLITMYTQIPLWGCYGMVGGSLFLIGALVIVSRAHMKE
jgi:hypothetical protein